MVYLTLQWTESGRFFYFQEREGVWEEGEKASPPILYLRSHKIYENNSNPPQVQI